MRLPKKRPSTKLDGPPNKRESDPACVMPSSSTGRYRIAKRTETVRVRLQPGGAWSKVSFAAGERDAAVRAHVRACAPALRGVVPRTLFVMRRERPDGSCVRCGGPGLAAALFEEQLVHGAEVV